MASQEEAYKQQFLALVAQFNQAFPGVTPPASEWWQLWVLKYTFRDIAEALTTLADHQPSLKSRFTTDSTGKAISSLLRANALRRATTFDSPVVQK
jgi:hypothetical protein